MALEFKDLDMIVPDNEVLIRFSTRNGKTYELTGFLCLDITLTMQDPAYKKKTDAEQMEIMVQLYLQSHSDDFKDKNYIKKQVSSTKYNEIADTLLAILFAGKEDELDDIKKKAVETVTAQRTI